MTVADKKWTIEEIEGPAISTSRWRSTVTFLARIGDEFGALASDGTVFLIFVLQGGVQLIEISADDFVADTWYQDIQRAMLDAYETLRVDGNDWHFIPRETQDPVDYVRDTFSTKSNADGPPKKARRYAA